MSEARSVFIEDAREKKQLARNYKQKHRGKRGNKVRNASDHLTPAQLRALNGEVFVYKIGEPISWGVFKSYPKEKQQEWINAFAERFQCSTKGMELVFGILNTSIYRYCSERGLTIPKGNRFTETKGEAIRAWIDEKNPPAPAPQPVQEEPKKPAKPAEPVIPYFVDTLQDGTMHLTGTATEIFQTLFGIFKTVQLDVTLNYKVIQPQPVQGEPKPVEAPEPEAELVDVNLCSFNDLLRVGFHAALAKNVVQRRPYKTVDDLRSVPGMTTYAFQILSPRVKV